MDPLNKTSHTPLLSRARPGMRRRGQCVRFSIGVVLDFFGDCGLLQSSQEVRLSEIEIRKTARCHGGGGQKPGLIAVMALAWPTGV